MGGTKNAQKQRMKALAKARAVATAKRKEAKRLGIPLSEVQLPPSAAELELIAAQEKEKQVRNFDTETNCMIIFIQKQDAELERKRQAQLEHERAVEIKLRKSFNVRISPLVQT